LSFESPLEYTKAHFLLSETAFKTWSAVVSIKLAFWSEVVQSQMKDKKALPPADKVCCEKNETSEDNSFNESMVPFSSSLSLTAWLGSY